MWLLVLSLAMHPDYTLVTTQAQYKTESACKKALQYAMAKVDRDGIIVIGKCTAAATPK